MRTFWAEMFFTITWQGLRFQQEPCEISTRTEMIKSRILSILKAFELGMS